MSGWSSITPPPRGSDITTGQYDRIYETHYHHPDILCSSKSEASEVKNFPLLFALTFPIKRSYPLNIETEVIMGLKETWSVSKNVIDISPRSKMIKKVQDNLK